MQDLLKLYKISIDKISIYKVENIVYKYKERLFKYHCVFVSFTDAYVFFIPFLQAIYIFNIIKLIYSQFIHKEYYFQECLK